MNKVRHDGISVPTWTRTFGVTISAKRTVISTLSITSGMALSTIYDSESVPDNKLLPGSVVFIYLVSFFNKNGHRWTFRDQAVPVVTHWNA